MSIIATAAIQSRRQIFAAPNRRSAACATRPSLTPGHPRSSQPWCPVASCCSAPPAPFAIVPLAPLTGWSHHMELRTADQYVASLRDGRQVFFRGERVDDVTGHPTISTAVKHAAIDYEIADSPEHRDLAVV